MHDLALQVGEKSPPGSDPVMHGQGLGKVHVRGMLRVAQRIHDERVHALEQVHGLRQDGLRIRDVGAEFTVLAAEEVADGFHLPMQHGQGSNRGFAQMKGAVNGLGKRLQVTAITVLAVKRIIKHPLQHGQAGGQGIHGHEFIRADGETAQFVKASQVIHVRMGEDGRIQVADARAQALGTQVRAGVHDPAHLRRAQPQAGAQAVVPGIGAVAGRAIAADHRDANGRAGAEKGEREVRHSIQMYSGKRAWETQRIRRGLFCLAWELLRLSKEA